MSVIKPVSIKLQYQTNDLCICLFEIISIIYFFFFMLIVISCSLCDISQTMPFSGSLLSGSRKQVK